MTPLSREFRATTAAQLRRASYRRAALCDSLNAMFRGEFEIGKSMLRDFVNGTIGFTKLAAEMNRSPKSLMRMLGPDGNPQTKNFFELIAVLQRQEGVKLEMRSTKLAA